MNYSVHVSAGAKERAEGGREQGRGSQSQTGRRGKRKAEVYIQLNTIPRFFLCQTYTHRLLHDASRSSEATNHALEVVKSQLQQAQEELDREREAGHRAKVSLDTHPLV